jgi:membrane-bound ClpP family serine protease
MVKWLCWLALALMAMLTALSSPLQAEAERHVQVLTVKGVINPLTAGYLNRALKQAEAEGATAVILQLDTPGGLEGAMREITQAMLNSPLPVVVYVAPAGARATSAGLFITLAAHVAAMAPSTNIGAAHPVALGRGVGGEVESAIIEKMVSDAAATARALAERRGRDPEWAEKAVRESLSLTCREALARGVVDLIAPDLQTLLAEIDGWTVETTQGAVTLRTQGAAVVMVPMNLIERLLHVITDPNLAYLLLVLGMWALIIEFQEPGALVPGISGVIMLILAFAALGSLPSPHPCRLRRLPLPSPKFERGEGTKGRGKSPNSPAGHADSAWAAPFECLPEQGSHPRPTAPGPGGPRAGAGVNLRLPPAGLLAEEGRTRRDETTATHLVAYPFGGGAGLLAGRQPFGEMAIGEPGRR